MDDPKEIFFLPEQKGGRGRKMWTTWEIKGLGIEGCILKTLTEVQKRNKLKIGRCVDKTIRPWSLQKWNKYLSREMMHKTNKLIK